MRRIAFLFLLLLLLTGPGVRLAAAHVLTMPPTDDATVTCIGSDACYRTQSGLLAYGHAGEGQALSALLEFDLAVIPAGATVQSAHIGLTPLGAYGAKLGCVYNGQDGVIQTSESNCLISVSFDVNDPAGSVTDMTPRVQAALIDGIRYLGVRMGASPYGPTYQLHATESPYVEARPYLEVTYALPADVPLFTPGVAWGWAAGLGLLAGARLRRRANALAGSLATSPHPGDCERPE